MKNLLLQARVVTDPLINPLAGWWCEFYIFYCKHRDLNEPMRSTLINMMIDPSVTVTTTAGSAIPHLFQNAGSATFLQEITQRVVACYFRDQNEAVGSAVIGNHYCAQVSQQTFLDSAHTEAAMQAGAPGLVVGADDTITGQEIDKTWILWQQYRAANLTHMTYEEYLSTYGIPLPAGGEGARRPELVRFVRDWSYPSNTVNPVDGTPSSAVSWAIAERADKDRFFREPGWLCGFTVVRPKAYFREHRASVSSYMKDALAWLPAVMGDNPEYSVRTFPFSAGTGPLEGQAAPYVIDLKDLFLYGEQFVNYEMVGATTGLGNLVILPGAGMAKKYPAAADADRLFKNVAANTIRMDGIVSLNILGQQIETTPTATPGGF